MPKPSRTTTLPFACIRVFLRPTPIAASRATLKDLEGAIADYSRALAFDPRLHNVRHNRAKAYSELGLNALALEDLEAALASDPTDTEAHMDRAIVLERLGAGPRMFENGRPVAP